VVEAQGGSSDVVEAESGTGGVKCGGRGGATRRVPPCPVRHRLGWRGGGGETSTGETAVSCRPRETELEAVASCSGEERQPTMAVSGAVMMAASGMTVTMMTGVAAMAAHRQNSTA
jgi:hypothetical protein